MNANLDKSLSSSERLSSIQGEASLSGSPCNGGVCSTTLGDIRCKTCGRTEEEVRTWHQMPEIERKVINLKNAAEGFKIRQTQSQEDRWSELQKLRTIDNLSIGDVFNRVLKVATSQSEMYRQDHKCIDILKKIIASGHDINNISVQSVMSKHDYTEIKQKFE